MRAIDQIRELYVSEAELADLLNIDTKRLRDLRSNHITGKHKFIDHYKPTSRSILYKLEDVLNFLEKSRKFSFGSASDTDQD